MNLAGVVVSVVPPASNAGVVEDYAAKVKDLENQVVPPVSDAGVVERGGRCRWELLGYPK